MYRWSRFTQWSTFNINNLVLVDYTDTVNTLNSYPGRLIEVDHRLIIININKGLFSSNSPSPFHAGKQVLPDQF